MIIHWRQRWDRAQAAQNYLATWVQREYFAAPTSIGTSIGRVNESTVTCRVVDKATLTCRPIDKQV